VFHHRKPCAFALVASLAPQVLHRISIFKKDQMLIEGMLKHIGARKA